MALGFLSGPMGKSMRGSGCLESRMGMGLLKQVMVALGVENGKMGREFPGLINYKIL